ncbi:MAG: hypothetical protein ACE5G2_03175 [Candidatus Krumholzibacteriia bacterium]
MQQAAPLPALLPRLVLGRNALALETFDLPDQERHGAPLLEEVADTLEVPARRDQAAPG